MSNTLIAILCILWCLGWAMELTMFYRHMRNKGIEYPNKPVKYLAPVVLFVAWPYFFTFEKRW